MGIICINFVNYKILQLVEDFYLNGRSKVIIDEM